MALEGSERELLKFRFGQYDHEIIGDTDAHTGLWYRIYVIAEAGVTRIIDNKADAADAYDLLTLGQGADLYGEFTSIQLSSGTVIAYEGPGW